MPLSIPVIDLSDPDDAATAGRLVDAAADHGFIYIRATGPANIDVESAFEMSRILFDSPVEEKVRCKIGRDNRGWAGLQTESLDPTSMKGDPKEAFNFAESASEPEQPLPAAVVPHKDKIAAFRTDCHALCLRILYLLGVGLEVNPPDYFSSVHLPERGPSSNTLRFLRYPPITDPADPAKSLDSCYVRAGAHSDYGSVTLLFRLRGQAGLQILTGDDEWVSVPVVPSGTKAEADSRPPILVNIGDLLSFWTRGLFRSTVHRVVFAEDGPQSGAGAGASASASYNDYRYSIAYFCHPADDTALTPVPSMRVRDFSGDGQKQQGSVSPGATQGGRDCHRVTCQVERAQTMTAKQYLVERLKETYGSLYRA